MIRKGDDKMGKNAKKYFREVKRLISTYSIDKRRFLYDVKSLLVEYENRNRGCTYDDYVAEFCKPEDLVTEYVQEMFEDNICQYVRKKHIKHSAIALCCVAILSISVLAGITVFNSLKDNNIYTEYQDNINDIMYNNEQGFTFAIEQVGADGTINELTRIEIY